MAFDIVLERRTLKKLEDICFNVVAKNFDDILSKHSSNKGIHFLLRKSQQLLTKFKETEGQYVLLEHALFCLNANLRELNLNWLKSCDISSIINKFETVQSSLTVLSAAALNDTSLDVLWRLICSLPKSLECLFLNGSLCTDSMIKIITKRCPNLQKLDLSQCHKISNSGIKHLCRKDGIICQNHTLQYLNLCGSGVTKPGVVFALENFPNLSEISQFWLEGVIYEMYYNNFLKNRPPPSTYNLKSLNIPINVWFAQHAVLKAFNTLCPYITKLEVVIETQADLDMCTEFSLLEEVRFSTQTPCNILPFIERRGKSLRTLVLRNWSECVVPPETLVRCCPRLECLKLRTVLFTEVNSPTDHDLQNSVPVLKELVIQQARFDHLEESLIFFISRSPNLEEFTFKNESQYISPFFTDALIQCISMSTVKKLVLIKVDIDLSKLTDSMSNFQLH